MNIFWNFKKFEKNFEKSKINFSHVLSFLHAESITTLKVRHHCLVIFKTKSKWMMFLPSSCLFELFLFICHLGVRSVVANCSEEMFLEKCPITEVRKNKTFWNSTSHQLKLLRFQWANFFSDFQRILEFRACQSWFTNFLIKSIF